MQMNKKSILHEPPKQEIASSSSRGDTDTDETAQSLNPYPWSKQNSEKFSSLERGAGYLLYFPQ